MLSTSAETIETVRPRPAGAPRATQPTIRAHLGKAAAAIWLSMERGRQRRALAELDDRLLRDIGLTRTDVWHEIAKPFWRC
jgi:uncharacterized protein YjiS (DUF1127 family)